MLCLKCVSGFHGGYMAITLSNIERHKSGDQFKITATATFDSSYATGGEQFSSATLGMAYIQDVVVNDSKGYTFDPVIASGGLTCKLKAYYGDYDLSSEDALVEVASTTDLSSIAPMITVYGK